jgi:hypothetical protein
MALSETAKLFVNLSLTGDFVSKMGKANKSLSTFEASSNRAYRAGQQIGTGIKNAGKIAAVGVGLLVSQVGFGLKSLIDLEKATAQTEAVIKSTGATAGVTAEEVRKLSEKYEAMNATVGDEVIQSGQNLLLTFTAVRKEAFEPALKAALDLSTAMGTDLDSAIKTVGKALSDPAKAISRLTRQGIILTKQEQKQIESHLKNNDTLAAQNVILTALDKRYGGSFLAGGQTTAAKVAKFGDAIEDIQRNLAVALLPAVSNVADALTELLADPEVIQGAKDLGEEIGKLFSKENVKNGARALGAAFDTIKSAMPAIKAGLSGVASVVGTAVNAFMSLPPEIQKLAVGALAVNKLTGGLVTNIAGGLISSVLKQLVSGVVNVQGAVVNVVGGAPGLPGSAAGAAGGIGAATLAAGAIVTAAAAAAVIAVQQSQSNKNSNFSAQIREGLDTSIVGKSQAELKTALAGVNQGITNLQSNPLLTLVQGDALSNLQAMRTSLEAQIARVDALKDQADRTKDDTVAAQEKTTRAANETKRETNRGTAIVGAATRNVATATRNVAPPIVAAIWGARPIVNVSISNTSITRVTTTTARYGKNTGSGGQNQVRPA